MSYPHFSTECDEHHGLVRDFGGARPRIVCLCGSSRFYDEYQEANYDLTMKGEIVLSIGLLNELFKAKWSDNLAGGLLESFGRLFKQGVTLQVFPWKNRKTSSTLFEATATMEMSAMVTAKISGFKRAPWQTGQFFSRIYCSISRRI